MNGDFRSIKKLFFPFLMTMVAAVQFYSNALAADLQHLPNFDSQEEDAWIARMNCVSRKVSDSNIPYSKYPSLSSSIVISKQASSNEIYDKLSCDSRIEVGGGYSWGGNEPSGGYGYVEGTASDNQGNYVHGRYDYDGERNRVSGGAGHEDKGRGRARN